MELLLHRQHCRHTICLKLVELTNSETAAATLEDKSKSTPNLPAPASPLSPEYVAVTAAPAVRQECRVSHCNLNLIKWYPKHILSHCEWFQNTILPVGRTIQEGKQILDCLLAEVRQNQTICLGKLLQAWKFCMEHHLMARTDQPFVSVNCQIQQVASILDKQECAKRILSEINLRSQVLLQNVTPCPIDSYSHSWLSGKLTCSCQPAPWSTCQRENFTSRTCPPTYWYGHLEDLIYHFQRECLECSECLECPCNGFKLVRWQLTRIIKLLTNQGSAWLGWIKSLTNHREGTNLFNRFE